MSQQELQIHTRRLTLRHITECDWQGVQRIWEDAKASPYAQYDRPHNTDSTDVRSRIAHWAEASKGTEHIFFSVCLHDAIIGYIAFNLRADGYEIGYCFHSDYHGKGYARESLSALMAYMKDLGAAKLTAGTAINNTPSVRLLTALGFRLTKVEKVFFYKDDAGNNIVFDGGVYERTL
ncbi:GNAT family N-acetyltransferase [uncultured Pseudoflavonifractor sp.]|uniref:GNAT family N-acetyltransferase n=1 Tax=uncultured Pseudoflavonifractor sp. TaxID=1221379 RepID=UPI0025CCC5AF|nr:GNAT family N-acetyltransferase [uncultured Pseudoflavonifractor sp.]